MNKVTLSLVALATLGGAAQVQAADLTPEEQKAEAIKAKKAAIDEVRKVLNAASIQIETECPGVKDPFIIRKTKCFRILERNAKISKTKRNFSRLYPTPQKFKKIDRLRRNEIHLKAVRTSS
jgi:hypothetical protein